ncbi:MAG TPA: MotA/TolQ/ExbB proton channel family protein, partial [bacterium]|nr:MotA/TolQ/ExbB proton channel family protein [bacterium]
LKAFKIYNKVAIPEMCMLPILAPKKIKILELSQLPQNFDNLIALKKQLDNDINNVNLLKVFFDECLKYQSYLYSVVYVDDEIYVGSLGRQPASIIVFGNLNGYYNLKNKRVYGILNFQKDRKKIEAIDYFKTLSYSKKIKALFENLESGKLFFAPIDISQGRARERLEFGKNIIEYLKSGGLLVYPILLIGLISIIIVIERLIFLKRKIGNSDELTTNIIELIQKKDWQTAENICKQKKWLIAKILLRGIQNKNADAEQMTNVLNAAALFEIPKLERYLSTLNVFAAITPLLGLLGTVVGMIKTFEAISIFGAGDPRLMSAGISEALITTELGLSVAIPILFIHNLLENKVDIVVSDIARDCLRFCNALK